MPLPQINRLSKVCMTLTLILVCATTHAAYPSNYVRDSDSPRISKKQIRNCPVADGFDFPVGKPNAKGYYNAQKFTRNNHLADDWNGVGGGNSDLNDPIYSIANGIVVQTKNYGGAWGRVTRILHNAGTREKPVYVESLYAHMRKILVKKGMIVKRGQKIGTIGNANGAWWAHLHLEIRTTINKSIGVGYSRDTTGYTDPTKYIRRHRPPWHYAARKRRLEKLKKARKTVLAQRAALKLRQQRRAAKGKNPKPMSTAIATILLMVETSLDSIAKDEVSTYPASVISHAETVASNVWSGSMYALTIAEDTNISTLNTTKPHYRTETESKRNSQYFWPKIKTSGQTIFNPSSFWSSFSTENGQPTSFWD